jgi:5-methylcytosine-specific restriction endonuclease McrA
VSFDEALKAMANTFLDKKDPLRKAQRVQSLKLKKTMMQDQATQRKTQEGQEIHQGQEIKEVERIQQNETTQKSQEIQQTQRPQSLQCQENLKPTTALQNSAQDVRLRKPIPSQLKRQVYLRDEGKCQKDNCGDSRWVDVHHIHPVMEEGENILENLITLCRGHHQLEHSHDTHL